MKLNGTTIPDSIVRRVIEFRGSEHSFADLDPAQHAADILTFAGQYAAHPEGLPVWRERPEIVKRSVLARVPPLTPAQREEERAAQ